MNKRKVVTLKEVEKAQKRAKALARHHDISYSEIYKNTKVRTKHPIKRTIIFIFGLISAYFAFLAYFESNYLVGTLLFLLALFLFYISYYGDREKLSECILETGDTALEAVGEIDVDIDISP